MTVTAKDEWKWTAEVTEDKLDGYTADYYGFNVTNTYNGGNGDTPGTGDKTLWLSLLVGSAVALWILIGVQTRNKPRMKTRRQR